MQQWTSGSLGKDFVQAMLGTDRHRAAAEACKVLWEPSQSLPPLSLACQAGKSRWRAVEPAKRKTGLEVETAPTADLLPAYFPFM